MTAAEIEALMIRIFGSFEAAKKSLPNRVWVQSKTGWFSKDRMLKLEGDE